MKKSELREMTVAELRDINRNEGLDIPGAWKMKKDQLVEEIFISVCEAWDMIDDEIVEEQEVKRRGRKNKPVQVLKDGKEVIVLGSQKETYAWARENKICNDGWVKESLKTGRETVAGRKFKEGGYKFRYL